MTKSIKVIMNLTDRDAENAGKLKQKLHVKNNAESVSAALSIVSSLTDLMDEGDEFYVKNKRGDMEKLVITGLSA
jgi:hypothetical protein